MSWLYLLLAGVTEIGWPVGLKVAQSGHKLLGISMAIMFMTVSGGLLFAAQKVIPMGTAYAVWTGIGAAGTFLVGVYVYGDPASMARYIGIMLILSGVVLLKFGH